MFSPQFYSRNENHQNNTDDQHFDCKISCGKEQFAIEEITDHHKHVIAIKLFRFDSCRFVFVQEFCAHQFHGEFFANIRAEDFHCNGGIDLVVDVYNAHCYLCGTVVLTHPCTHKLELSHHHRRPPHFHHCQDPCEYPAVSFPCPPPSESPCLPPNHNPCLKHTVSRSDVANCKFLSVDIKDAPVISANEILVKPLPSITSNEKLCDIIQCCKKTTECLKEFDPHFECKLKKKEHTTYSGPVKADIGLININDCSITFDGLDVACKEHQSHHFSENCIKF